MKRTIISLLVISTCIFPLSTFAKPPVKLDWAPNPAYADLADRALPATVVGVMAVTKVTRLDQKQFPLLPPGMERMLIKGRIMTLIRGPVDQPVDVRLLADLPIDGKGRPPKLGKQPMMVFGDRVTGKADQIHLLDRYSLLPWTAEMEQQVRTILTDAVAQGAAPKIRDIGNVFSVPGSVPGESETQIFLDSATGQPVSISILRRPGQGPRWIVSLDEIVDEAAAFPARDTLTWYRLACFLPGQLPLAKLEGVEPPQMQIAAEDYRFVIQQMGDCRRNMAPVRAGLR